MNRATIPVRKITISLSQELVDFADRKAAEMRSNRSQIISQALATVRGLEEERLAAEGYEFFASEAKEFAAASKSAVIEAWTLDEVIDDASEAR
jgi:metal-responsive CopG/Arc/MetJ family transcriptional regulator